MRYLVTGGAGFIGSHLCDLLLASNAQVIVLDNFSTGKMENINATVEVVHGDCADLEIVAPLVAKVDGVFHLAAIASVEMSLHHWQQTTQANLLATVTMLDAIAKLKRKVPFVCASSAAIYGDCQALPITEATAPNPKTAYGVDKYGSELHAKVGSELHGIPTSCMRFFNVYGERQDPASPYSGVVSIFINNFLQNNAVTIFGDGEQTRDFIYVGDVVQFLQAAMLAHHTGGAEHFRFNVCTGKQTSLNQLAEVLKQITGSTSMVHYADAKNGDIKHSFGSPALIERTLNYSAKTDIAAGLAATIKHCVII